MSRETQHVIVFQLHLSGHPGKHPFRHTKRSPLPNPKISGHTEGHRVNITSQAGRLGRTQTDLSRKKDFPIFYARFSMSQEQILHTQCQKLVSTGSGRCELMTRWNLRTSGHPVTSIVSSKLFVCLGIWTSHYFHSFIPNFVCTSRMQHGANRPNKDESPLCQTSPGR